MTTTSITFRTNEETKCALDELAERQRRSRSFIVTEAISAYIAQQDRDHQRVLEGIAAAERGDFATDEKVKATFQRLRARCE